ncbi:MAG: ABC transporter permease [Firmicutes bacterium]|nr:ABC transporter permease [Alicyclobacillaceae bacterium]MCL6497856.1 ABC transporter permease [Bacillota bacterium]
MAQLGREWQGAWAVARRNWDLVRRYLGWEVAFLLYNAISAVTIALIGETAPAAQRAQEVMYLTLGALVWNFLSIIFQEVASAVTWERWEGTIEVSFMAPLRRASYLLGTAGYAVGYGLVRTVAVLGAIRLFLPLHLPHPDWAGAVLVLVASVLPFVGMGLLGAVLPILSTERGTQATQVIQGVILLVSGVYYPVTVLPGWVRWLSALSPATYTLSLSRAAVLQGVPLAELWRPCLALAASGLMLVPLGLWVFHRGEHWAMRRGTLKRSG